MYLGTLTRFPVPLSCIHDRWFRCLSNPVATLGEQFSELLQILPVFLIKSVHDCTINVYDGHDLLARQLAYLTKFK